LQATVGFLWDVAEYLTLFKRRGRGMPLKLMIGIELVITIGCVPCLGMIVYIFIELVRRNGPLLGSRTISVAGIAALLVMLLILA
jgi:hypothetical protein